MAIIGASLINCKLCDVKLKLQNRIAGNLSHTVLNIIYSEVLHSVAKHTVAHKGQLQKKCILVQANMCRCKQLYINEKRIKHYVILINVAEIDKSSYT